MKDINRLTHTLVAVGFHENRVRPIIQFFFLLVSLLSMENYCRNGKNVTIRSLLVDGFMNLRHPINDSKQKLIDIQRNYLKV